MSFLSTPTSQLFDLDCGRLLSVISIDFPIRIRETDLRVAKTPQPRLSELKVSRGLPQLYVYFCQCSPGDMQPRGCATILVCLGIQPQALERLQLSRRCGWQGGTTLGCVEDSVKDKGDDLPRDKGKRKSAANKVPLFRWRTVGLCLQPTRALGR